MTALIIAAALAAPSAVSAQAGRTKPASRRAVASAAKAPTSAPRLKGIWEPVNYGQDLTLHSVYFVTPSIGWASGDAGTIIKTTDGGVHWTAQLGGDPQNQAEAITDLQFVDQHHGFAAQVAVVGDNHLLRTTDGEHWRASGTVPQHRGDFVFVSPTVGFTSTDREIRRTRDAGRSWEKVMDCAAKVTVSGLPHNVSCMIEQMSFPTPQVGYGMGVSGDVHGVFIARTTDGGGTWSVSRVLPDENAHQGFITFTDARHGLLCTFEGHFYETSDGGTTWDGVAGTGCSRQPARFADPRTGWMVENGHWSYSTDGGSTWTRRSLALPAGVYSFSLPRRDRGYIVGEHGMVYRYGIVPVAYTAANSYDAPVVGPFDPSLESRAAKLASLAAAPNENAATATALQSMADTIVRTVPQFVANYRNLNLLYEGTRTTNDMERSAQTLKSAVAALQQANDPAAGAAARSQIAAVASSLRQQASVAGLESAMADAPESASESVAAPGDASASASGDRSGSGGGARDSTAANGIKEAAKKKLGGMVKLPFGHRP